MHLVRAYVTPCATPQAADHFNAEVVAGTIASTQDAMDYLTWTFFYRRLLQNPTYYDLDGTGAEDVSAFLSRMVERTLAALQVCPGFVRPCQHMVPGMRFHRHQV